jgi:hypothetical protein
MNLSDRGGNGVIKFIGNNKNRFDQGVGMFEGLLDVRNRHASVDVTSIKYFIDATDRSMSCKTHHQVYENYKLRHQSLMLSNFI